MLFPLYQAIPLLPEKLCVWCYCPTALLRVFRCLIFINSDVIVLSSPISQISNKTEPIFPVLSCQVPVQEYGPFFYRIVCPFLIDLYEFFIKIYINPLSVCCMQIASPSLGPVFIFFKMSFHELMFVILICSNIASF